METSNTHHARPRRPRFAFDYSPICPNPMDDPNWAASVAQPRPLVLEIKCTLVAITDGASANQADPIRRLAGVGAFFAPASELNMSLPLPGPEQTNQRTEL